MIRNDIKDVHYYTKLLFLLYRTVLCSSDQVAVYIYSFMYYRNVHGPLTVIQQIWWWGRHIKGVTGSEFIWQKMLENLDEFRLHLNTKLWLQATRRPRIKFVSQLLTQSDISLKFKSISVMWVWTEMKAPDFIPRFTFTVREEHKTSSFVKR